MTQADNASARKTLSTRLGTSPKTLHRKAMAKAAAAPAPEGEGLEDMFPASPLDADVASAPGNAAPLPIATAVGQHAASQSDDSATVTDGVVAGDQQTAAAPAIDIIESSAAPKQADEPVATPPSTIVKNQSAPAAPAQLPTVSPWSEADERAYQAMAARRKAAGFQRRGRNVSAQQVILGAVTPNPGTVYATIAAIVGAAGNISRGELIDLMATATFSNVKAKPTDRNWCTAYIAGAARDGVLAWTDSGQILGEHSPEASNGADL
ncbi:hypothetical protein [Sphingomonas bisphenolicum]|uniref:Uncharacterized protein n=1 Tax=Sphingomonas bisphenolicum TaxID=296544 RepID=A0ABM7G2I7_9SPHN|nr:hypothetical protein [Sphingomonas bisphenolicum]BBF68815.1 hypothetical protein SBA_ch1_10150 [Sphingomonas bisphenolicum]